MIEMLAIPERLSCNVDKYCKYDEKEEDLLVWADVFIQDV